MGKIRGVLAELIHVCAEARGVLAACMALKEETVRIQNEAQEAQEEQWRLQNRILSLRKELAGLEHKHHHAKVRMLAKKHVQFTILSRSSPGRNATTFRCRYTCYRAKSTG